MKADAKTEAEVMAVLSKLAEAREKQNLDDMMALFAPDPDVVLIGTGADEKWIGLAEIKAKTERAWSQFESASYEFEWSSVSAAGSVAWVATDITGHAKVGGQETTLSGRLTTVLEKRGGKWLIVHSHFSLPASL